MQQQRSYRIRRCDGNRAAWLFNILRQDGSESDSYGSYTTGHSLESLIARVKMYDMVPCICEIVYVPAEEGEHVARTVRQAYPGARVHVEHRAPTELTPIGEQYVIPGCEKHERPKGAQLKLWER
jgi:hypothetical protein